jgi:uncharacterized PurR-regulated membrane protein YhhQ (DUF165 family)
MPMVALEADEGPYRLRDDAVWPPRERAYGGAPQDPRQRYARPIRITVRLLLPVTLLIVLLGAAYLYTDEALMLAGAPALVQRAMLATSDLILPLAWFSLHLTNRRYGAPYAFGQMMAAMGVIALVALLNPGDVDNWIAMTPALSWRAILAFGASFLLSGFIAITLFDAARGPRWWTAPLVASFAAALVFSAVYYPAAFAGGDEIVWTDSALVHFALYFAESLLLLVPYYLLRPAMRPLHGMNGY